MCKYNQIKNTKHILLSTTDEQIFNCLKFQQFIIVKKNKERPKNHISAIKKPFHIRERALGLTFFKRKEGEIQKSKKFLVVSFKFLAIL